MPIEARFRIQASLVYAWFGVATIAWWAMLIWFPACRPVFFGRFASDSFMWLFLAPDLACALIGAILMWVAVAKGSQLAKPGSTLLLGAQGYATLFAVGIAVQDSQAYPGAVAMLGSTGTLVALAMRLNQIPLLWGPFRFKASDRKDSAYHWKQSLAQTAAMWIVFLVLVPVGIVWLENLIGADRYRFAFPFQWPISIALFAIGGCLGLTAAKSMIERGSGTPLPSRCAQNLVIAGPYRFIRNPMAFGGILQGCTVGLSLGSAMTVVYALLGAFFWDILARPLEEQYLEDQFGEPYVAYRNTVPCWRFRFSNPMRPDSPTEA